jgi:alpha/beta hydrolase fold
VEECGCVRRFRSWDGTDLAYRVVGSGPPLVCVPGGPGQAGDYLGELGGLSRHRTLILLDNRGTGASSVPGDAATYRVDRIVRDVEALRRHLPTTAGVVYVRWECAEQLRSCLERPPEMIKAQVPGFPVCLGLCRRSG